jgi:hypothetical protein
MIDGYTWTDTWIDIHTHTHTYTHTCTSSYLSPFGASLFITIDSFRHYQIPIGLVYSIHDPTEVAIQKMIDASQRMLKMNSQGGEGAAGGGMEEEDQQK